jgi:hypothetical protein
MTKEEKELLLKDLCARLPYGVIGEYSWKGNEPHNRELTGNLYDELNSSWSSTGDSKFIPYLRPMSSMTEEEVDEFTQFDIYADGEYIMPNHEAIDWLNKNMFDYRGLIPMGLAIEVTEENNPYKE